MEWAVQLGWDLTDALLLLFAQPFYYIAILLIALGYRRQSLLERRLFHTRLEGWGIQTLRTAWGGLLAGLGISLLSLLLGIQFTPEAVICIWIAAAILMLFRVRYLCFAYAVGLLGVLQFIFGFAKTWQPEGWIGRAVDTVRGLDIPSLLILVAVLHIAEAVLVRWQGGRMATPLFIEGKRGRLVGGYQMEDYWPIPLLLLVPAQGGAALPWTPLVGWLHGDWSGGFSMAALPILIGFSGMTQSMLPRQKAAVSAKRLVMYSLVLLILGVLAAWWSPLMIVAALASFFLHELIIWYGSLEEQQHSPLFVHPEAGLRVLAVLPDSPAKELGILAGEVIYKVNGVLITSRAELHRALRMNPAFCKLEVRNLQGESKFLQRAIFAGDHHQLGVILAPDQEAEWAVSAKPASIYRVIAMSLNARRKDRAASGSGNSADM
ncbi:PDZ domain-containing protein [Paenibacillus sp. JX-17]|uniref:PDZ domain-containing protein n=1 Tax=Paenibacillus lacisoli TaxID=3064525 RepID=A0ABT9CG78_9BACL|nr:PDZ domain-containing protein [Paenibacillus sp. JX-17]MDO7906613.1 PDZ domain-containing protein [Paenibacillus sp. JX-17]